MKKDLPWFFSLLFVLVFLPGCGGGGGSDGSGAGSGATGGLSGSGQTPVTLASLQVTAQLQGLPTLQAVQGRVALTTFLEATLKSATQVYGLSNPEPIAPGSSTVTVEIGPLPEGSYTLEVRSLNESGLTTGFVRVPVTLASGSQSVQVEMQPSVGIGPGLGGASNPPAPPFTSARSFPNLDSNAGPTSATTADIDGNGQPDVITSSNGKMSLFLADGPGRFRAAAAVSQVAPASLVVCGDFNGDRTIDLATAGSELVLYLGQGNGSFLSGQIVPVNAALISLKAADLNRDGSDELVAFASSFNQDPQGNAVLVFPGGPSGLGNPSATELSVESPGTVTGSVEVGDFDGDGDTDVASALGSQVFFFANAGGALNAGSVTSFSRTFTSQQSRMCSGDFDNDGFVDLAVGHNDEFGTRVFYGSPSGLSAPLEVDLEILIGDLCSGDFNGDGRDDLAASNLRTEGTTIALSIGRGFAPSQYYYGGCLNSLVSADFNGDDKSDLAGQTIGSLVTFLTGTEDLFEMPRWLGITSRIQSLSPEIAAGDVNEDGLDDFAVAEGQTTPIRVHPALGSGTFGLGQVFGDPLTNERFSTVEFADMDNDGHLDLFSGSKVRLGRGDGTFPEDGIAVPRLDPGAFVIDDFNGDTIPDLAGARIGTVTLALGLGDGNVNVSQSINTASSIPVLKVGDFNGDRNLDIAWHQFESGIWVSLGGGDGTLSSPMQVFQTERLNQQALAAGDFNEDGVTDLIAIRYEGVAERDTALLLIGNGSGNFDSPIEFEVGRAVGSVFVDDLNGDGHLDFATANGTSVDTTILLGNGAGGFTSGPALATGLQPEKLSGGDFNGDGKRDLLIGARGGQVLLLRR